MKKTLSFVMLPIFFFMASLLFVQVQSNQLNYRMESEHGDIALLDKIHIQEELNFNSSRNIQVNVEQGAVSYAYQNIDRNRSWYDLQGLVQHELLSNEDPVLDESKKIDMSEGRPAFYNNIPCTTLGYPQASAQLQLNLYDATQNKEYYYYDQIDTLLTVYTQDEYQLMALVRDCENEDPPVSDIESSYGFEESEIEHMSDGTQFMMPNIRPNMDGTVSIYRLKETKRPFLEGNVQKEMIDVSAEAVYEFEVKRNSYGTMRIIHDQIYVWTWQDQSMKLQIFDENLKLLQEDVQTFSLNPDLTTLKTYVNDDYLIVNVQEQFFIYDTKRGELLEQFQSEPFIEGHYVTDMMYQDGRIYLAIEEVRSNDTSYDPNPIILVWEDGKEVYRGKLIIYETVFDADDIYKDMTYMHHSPLKFVRNAL